MSGINPSPATGALEPRSQASVRRRDSRSRTLTEAVSDGSKTIAGLSALVGTFIGGGLVFIVRRFVSTNGLSPAVETWLLSAIPLITSTVTILVSNISRSVLARWLRRSWNIDRTAAAAECDESLNRLKAAADVTSDESVLRKGRSMLASLEDRRLTIAAAIFPNRPWSTDK